MTELTEDAVRAKAYELWEARGRPFGSAQDDWFHALEQLAEKDPKQNSAVQLVTDGMFAAATLAIGAATHAVEEFFGSLKPKHLDESEPAAPIHAPAAIDDEALETAERKLQLDADKRMQDAAISAGVSTEPDHSKVGGAGLNPDG